MEEQLQDWRDIPIEIGSKIVYPSRRSSSLWMTEGVVTDITRIQVPYWDYEGPQGNRVRVKKLHEEIHVGVRRVQCKYGVERPDLIVYPEVSRMTVVF